MAEKTGSQQHPSLRELRDFGLLLGSVFTLITFWPWLSEAISQRWWAFCPAALCFTLGVIGPSLLHHPYRFWMRIGGALGWLNTRIILGGIFFLVMTPMAYFMRFLGSDPLGLQKSSQQSYRSPKPIRSSRHLEHQY